MDTFELLVSFHLRLSPSARVPPPFLGNLLVRIIKQPLWLRNTLLLIYRFFSAVFKTINLTGGQAIEWLLSGGFPTFDESMSRSELSTNNRPFELACTLVLAARDVALAQPASH